MAIADLTVMGSKAVIAWVVAARSTANRCRLTSARAQAADTRHDEHNSCEAMNRFLSQSRSFAALVEAQALPASEAAQPQALRAALAELLIDLFHAEFERRRSTATVFRAAEFSGLKPVFRLPELRAFAASRRAWYSAEFLAFVLDEVAVPLQDASLIQGAAESF